MKMGDGGRRRADEPSIQTPKGWRLMSDRDQPELTLEPSACLSQCEWVNTRPPVVAGWLPGATWKWQSKHKHTTYQYSTALHYNIVRASLIHCNLL